MTDVPRNSLAHRAAAVADCASMTGGAGQMRQRTTAEVCLDAGRAALQRLIAVRGVVQTACLQVMRDFLLSKTPAGTILVPIRSGIQGMSVNIGCSDRSPVGAALAAQAE